MVIDIGPNTLTLLTLLIPSVTAIIAAYYSRQSSVQSAKTNGQVGVLQSREHIRTHAEAVAAEVAKQLPIRGE